MPSRTSIAIDWTLPRPRVRGSEWSELKSHLQGTPTTGGGKQRQGEKCDKCQDMEGKPRRLGDRVESTLMASWRRGPGVELVVRGERRSEPGAMWTGVLGSGAEPGVERETVRGWWRPPRLGMAGF